MPSHNISKQISIGMLADGVLLARGRNSLDLDDDDGEIQRRFDEKTKNRAV